MNIFFIGASSFTGYWFINSLLKNHTIFAPLTLKEEEYTGVKKQRIENLKGKVIFNFASKFGSRNFFQFLQESKPDIICFHHALTNNYNNKSFDIYRALDDTLYNFKEILKYVDKNNLEKIIISRSIAESAFNNNYINNYEKYAKYKTEFASIITNVFPKELIYNFVISNPIGHLNNYKLLESFAERFFRGQDFKLSNPFSIQDYIPITLLADEYSKFLSQNLKKLVSPKFKPCQNIDFILSVSKLFAMRYKSSTKLIIPVNLEVSEYYGKDQINYTETQISEFWQELINYFQQKSNFL